MLYTPRTAQSIYLVEYIFSLTCHSQHLNNRSIQNWILKQCVNFRGVLQVVNSRPHRQCTDTHNTCITNCALVFFILLVFKCHKYYINHHHIISVFAVCPMCVPCVCDCTTKIKTNRKKKSLHVMWRWFDCIKIKSIHMRNGLVYICECVCVCRCAFECRCNSSAMNTEHWTTTTTTWVKVLPSWSAYRWARYDTYINLL